jgi:hypothetical protein
MQCNALGLNSHFSRALLHGLVLLGGLGIPTQTEKTTKYRIYSFLYNVRRPSSNRDKLEASIIYTQLEIGTTVQFFLCSYQWYGHLTTSSSAVQLWSECEPFGIKLRAAPSITWTPHPLTANNLFIMDLATKVYNIQDSTMINCCHLFLHIISIANMLTYGLLCIHPFYKAGERLPSRLTTIYWPEFTSPPRHYWKLWHHFIKFYIEPLLDTSSFSWLPNIWMMMSLNTIWHHALIAVIDPL